MKNLVVESNDEIICRILHPTTTDYITHQKQISTIDSHNIDEYLMNKYTDVGHDKLLEQHPVYYNKVLSKICSLFNEDYIKTYLDNKKKSITELFQFVWQDPKLFTICYSEETGRGDIESIVDVVGLYMNLTNLAEKQNDSNSKSKQTISSLLGKSLISSLICKEQKENVDTFSLYANEVRNRKQNEKEKSNKGINPV